MLVGVMHHCGHIPALLLLLASDYIYRLHMHYQTGAQSPRLIRAKGKREIKAPALIMSDSGGLAALRVRHKQSVRIPSTLSEYKGPAPTLSTRDAAKRQQQKARTGTRQGGARRGWLFSRRLQF
ncbi:hypothetical protein J3F83DRAFT_127990 [Trichoderma novae-zelandiae]